MKVNRRAPAGDFSIGHGGVAEVGVAEVGAFR